MKKYKCLCNNCDRKLEKNYLFCSLECAAYAGYFTAKYQKNHIIYLFRKIRSLIYYKWHMLLRFFL